MFALTQSPSSLPPSLPPPVLQNERRCECKQGYVGDGIQCLEQVVPPTDRCLQDNGQCHREALCTDLHFHGECAGSGVIFHRETTFPRPSSLAWSSPRENWRLGWPRGQGFTSVACVVFTFPFSLHEPS